MRGVGALIITAYVTQATVGMKTRTCPHIARTNTHTRTRTHKHARTSDAERNKARPCPGSDGPVAP